MTEQPNQDLPDEQPQPDQSLPEEESADDEHPHGETDKPGKETAPGQVKKDVPEGTVEDVLAWVGDDPQKAKAALKVENDSDSPRSTLVTALEGISKDDE